MASLKALAVRLTPFTSLDCQTPVTKIANAVKVHTTKVSIAGPNMATKPSRTGSSVFDAPWAIGAVPMPASLENAPRLIPNKINPPKTPPRNASPL